MAGSGVRSVIARLLVVLVALGLTSCAGRSKPSPPPDPAPKVSFRDFSVVESGGVDGRRNELLVRPDGVGLLLSRQPSAGRFDEPTMERLRTLLESDQFRTEVSARTEEDEPPTCTDQIAVRVTMGSLSMSRSGPCTGDSEAVTPVFAEILGLTAPGLRGDFDLPVPPGEPRLVGVRLADRGAGGEVGYRIGVGPAGNGSIAVPGEAVRRRTLPPPDRDTLRLLLARLTEVPAVDCASRGRHVLAVAGREPVSGSDCRFGERPYDFRAVVALLERAFGA